MPTSEALLTAVAVRLAMLVTAALVVRVLPDHSHRDTACREMQTVGVNLQTSKAMDGDERVNEMLREMRSHD